MQAIFVSLLVAVVVVEMVARSTLKIDLQSAALNYRKIFKVILSHNMSDYLKEKVLLRYALNIFICSSRAIALIFLILIAIAAAIWLTSIFFNNVDEAVNALISFKGVIFISLFSLIYYLFRKWFFG